MTKRTKNIILLAVGIWVGICIVSAAISLAGGNKETAPAQTETVAGTKTISIKDDAVLMRLKTLYDKLLSFKDDGKFHRYGFGEGGDYHGWFMASNNFSEEDDHHLMRTYGIVSGDLRQLGQEYLTSKGKETDYSRQMRETIESIFSSETWEVSE